MNQARPAMVTLAVIIQLIVVLLAVLGVAFGWLVHARTADGSALLAAIAITALGGLVAVWFAATAIPTWLGSNTARIMAIAGAAFYQVLALVLCVCGGVFAFLMLPFTMEPDDPWSTGSDPQQQAWAFFMIGIIFVVIGLALVTMAAGLLMPPTHRWYASKKGQAPALRG